MQPINNGTERGVTPRCCAGWLSVLLSLLALGCGLVSLTKDRWAGNIVQAREFILVDGAGTAVGRLEAAALGPRLILLDRDHRLRVELAADRQPADAMGWPADATEPWAGLRVFDIANRALVMGAVVGENAAVTVNDGSIASGLYAPTEGPQGLWVGVPKDSRQVAVSAVAELTEDGHALEGSVAQGTVPLKATGQTPTR